MRQTIKKTNEIYRNLMKLLNTPLPHETTKKLVKNITSLEKCMEKANNDIKNIKGFEKYQEEHNKEWRYFLEKNKINLNSRKLTQQEQRSWAEAEKKFNDKKNNAEIIKLIQDFENKEVEIDFIIFDDLTNIPASFILDNIDIFKV